MKIGKGFKSRDKIVYWVTPEVWPKRYSKNKI